MNVDLRNPSARPDPSLLVGQTYVRFPYNISNYTGVFTQQTAQAAADLYIPYINRLHALGKKPIVILVHQTFGEGENWAGMSFDEWGFFVDEWVEYVVEYVVKRLVGRQITYQVWNEQDNGSEAAVGLHPLIYSQMLRKAYTAIKAVDPSAHIISGGFVSGPGDGLIYTAKMEQGWSRYCDGISVHEYGSHGDVLPPGHRTGRIEPKIKAWKSVYNKPIWITEWGVLDRPQTDYLEVVRYAANFTQTVRPLVVTQSWFSYGPQHNAFPITGQDGQPRPELLAATAQGKVTTPTPTPIPTPVPGAGLRIMNIGALNFRPAPSTSAGVIQPGLTINKGDVIELVGETASDNVYRWQKIKAKGFEGWIAVEGPGIKAGLWL